MATEPGHTIKSELLEFLSTLPYIATVAERQALIKFLGFEEIIQQIEWEGTAVTFCARLLNLLIQSGQQTLVNFLKALATSSLIGIQQKEQLLNFSTQLAFLTVTQWRNVFFQQILERFKRGTAQDMKIVGKKYLPELYFSRLQIEKNFEQFLASDATSFLIVAKAGRGKTNLLCHIVEKLQEERPVLFITGRVEPKDSNGILRYIASRLGYGENWFQCFEELGILAGTGPAPLILIDGINESAAKPQVMQDALHELLVQADLHKVKVCVTCRTDFWKFYRASFWGEYTWRGSESSTATRIVRGEDLPIFPLEIFDQVVERYFQHFTIQGHLVGEAWERCRNPLLLRFFCEAYSERRVGIVTQIRLYALLKLFWNRKIENIQEVIGEIYTINRLILLIAQLMHQRHQTTVPRDDIAEQIKEEITRPESLYQRILDEEIIIEEELDELRGTANVIFVYDKFSEYAIALHIFSDYLWIKKSLEHIIADIEQLMEEETQQEFATLRGALEFLVLRLEDYRKTEGIHFNVINAMLEHDWKWRRIGTLLAFQLANTGDPAFWEFIRTLSNDKRDFVRRICAEQLNQLAMGHNEHVLPLLNRLLADGNLSVRQTARVSLFNLDAISTMREAELLVQEYPYRSDLTSLAAELLLSPQDSDSSLLQEKIRWLVKENSNEKIQQAVISDIDNLRLPAFGDIYILEELARAFQLTFEGNLEADNPYLKTIHDNLTERKNVLEAQLERLDALRLIIQFTYEFTLDFLQTDSEPEQILLANFRELLPDAKSRKKFLNMLDKETAHSLRSLSSTSILMIELALELAKGTDAFKTETVNGFLTWLDISTNTALFQLCSITNYIVREAVKVIRKGYSFANISVDLRQEGFHIEPDKRIDFLEKIASKFGVVLSTREHRTLTSLGRLSLWIWQAKALEREQVEAQQKKIEQIAKLSNEELKRHFAEFEVVKLSDELQRNLFLELQALGSIYAKSDPGKVIVALAPFIIWCNENDSPALSQAFQTLYRRDQDSFWIVARDLLENEDQRIIDFASQVLEQAEYAEEQARYAVPARLKKIIEDQLGVDESEIVPNASFVEDLNADSLDLIELIMSLEEEFKFMISDEDAEKMTTVQEVIDYIEAHVR